MSKLDLLIEYLKTQDLNDLKDKHLLMDTLNEFKIMIGNNDLKDQISLQVLQLLEARKEPNANKMMLNTILYGSPGTGKTIIGRMIAKIFYSMGYLQIDPKYKADQEKLMNMFKTDSQADTIGYLSIAILLFYFTITVLELLSNLIGWTAIGILLLIGIILACVILFLDKQPQSDVQIFRSDDDIFRVVSREDFVDQYIGWTDKKTLKLLNANRGKCLFIDEAYSLCTGIHDQYGLEAINTLNKFMSEHPGEIIIIFAGYKEDLQRGLFQYQSGLPRRCMFHFEIKPYTYSELFEIFKLQLSKQGYELRHPNKSLKLFRDNIMLFQNSGGDTERLCNFSLLEWTSDRMSKKLERDNIGIDIEKKEISFD